MKQLLFLLLFPCFAMAQYQGNGNQKITLGEQTTADGLVFRGVENDTALITPFSDTSAYIILDTINNKFYNYNRSTNVWSLAGGGGGGGGSGTVTSITAGTGLTGGTITTSGTLAADTNFLVTRFDTASMLLPYWQSGRFSGVLPVANGGTNTGTLNQNKVMVGNGTSGVLTPTDIHWDNSNSLLGVGETTLSTFKLTVKGAFPILFNTTSTANTLTYGGTRFFRNTSTLSNGNGFQYSFNDANGNAAEYGYFGGYIIDNTVGSTDGGFIFAPTLNNSRTEAMRILNDGNVGIGTSSPTEKLHVVGNARISGLANAANPVNVQVDVNGVLVRTSSIDIKEDVQSLPYGLNEVMLLQPSKFSYIDKYKYGEGYDIGFIAQDVNNVIPEAVGTGIESDIFMDSVKLIPVLTKAIQEQQALIKALEQRILILENK